MHAAPAGLVVAVLLGTGRPGWDTAVFSYCGVHSRQLPLRVIKL